MFVHVLFCIKFQMLIRWWLEQSSVLHDLVIMNQIYGVYNVFMFSQTKRLLVLIQSAKRQICK